MQLNIKTPKAVTAAVTKFNKLAASADKKTADAFREATLAAHQVRLVMEWYTHPDTKAEAKEAGGKLPSVKEYLPAVLGKAYSTLRRYVQVADAIDGGASIADYLTAEAEGTGTRADLLHVKEAHLTRFVQMDVEPGAVPDGNREDTVELTLRVTVDL